MVVAREDVRTITGVSKQETYPKTFFIHLPQELCHVFSFPSVSHLLLSFTLLHMSLSASRGEEYL